MLQLIATLALVLVPSASGLQGRAADEAAIRAQAAAYETAVNKRDAAGLAALFEPDGDFIFFDSPPLVGREAIQRESQAGFAIRPATMRFTLTVTGIRFLRPDLAIVETEARFSEGEMLANRGTFMMARRGGKWLVAALRVFPAQRP